MKHPIIRLVAVLAVAIITADPVHAQNSPGEKSIKCRFRLYGWDESITDLHYKLKDSDQPLVIYQDARSIFYDYCGPEVITLYRIKTDSEGKIVRETAAQANLAGGGSWPLVIIAKHQAKPGTFQSMVLKDDLITFPPGSYAFSNFSQTSVGGLLGTERFVLPPGENRLFVGKPKENSTTLAALFFAVSGSQKLPIYTNNWAIRPATRTRVFVRASSETPTGIVARRLVESTVFPPENKNDLTQAE